MLQLIVLLAGLSLAAPAAAEAYGSGWYGEIQASYGYEDNISRTYKRETFDDEIASISLGGGYSKKIGDNQQVIFSGYVTSTTHDEFDRIDAIAVSLGVDYTIQPNVEYDSPWYNVKVNATDLQYEDSDGREGLLIDAELSMNRRMTPRVTNHVGYRYQNLDGTNVWETDSHELFVGLDVHLRPNLFLFSEYAYRHGDIISTVAGGFDSVPAGWDAAMPDTVFDPPCPGPCPHGYAYRARGDVQTVTLGLSFPFNSLNFDISGVFFNADSDAGPDYEDWLIKFGFIWNF